MRINVFYKETVGSLDSNDGINENNNILARLGETFQSEIVNLLSDGDFRSKVALQVGEIEDPTKRNLLTATLNRLARLSDGSNMIHDKVHARLDWLKDSITA